MYSLPVLWVQLWWWWSWPQLQWRRHQGESQGWGSLWSGRGGTLRCSRSTSHQSEPQTWDLQNIASVANTLTVLKMILFQVAITTCMLNKCMNFAPWPWDTRSPRSNGYRIGSTPSTSCMIKVFPNLTANSRAVVKLAS